MNIEGIFPVFLLFSVLKFGFVKYWLDLEKKDLSWEIFLEISSLLSLHPSLLSLLLSFDVCRSSLPLSTASSCPADLRVRLALVDISFTDSEASSWMQKVHNYLKVLLTPRVVLVACSWCCRLQVGRISTDWQVAAIATNNSNLKPSLFVTNW